MTQDGAEDKQEAHVAGAIEMGFSLVSKAGDTIRAERRRAPVLSILW